VAIVGSQTGTEAAHGTIRETIEHERPDVGGLEGTGDLLVEGIREGRASSAADSGATAETGGERP
jgi:hypothetical protein